MQIIVVTLRWQCTDTPMQLIKKFWGLDFSELYTFSSNPAALACDRQTTILMAMGP